MKLSLSFIILIFPLLLFSEIEPAEKHNGVHPAGKITLWEKANYPERLRVSDLDIPLVFEGNPNESIRQVIIADLHLIYSDVESYERFDWSGRPGQPFEIKGNTLTSNQSINLNGRRSPKVVHENFGRVITIEGKEHIVVPKKLIEAYESAWNSLVDFRSQYQEMKLFIELVRNSSPHEPVQLRATNMLWAADPSGLQPSEIPGIVERFSGLDLRFPSILEFQIDTEKVKSSADLWLVAKAYIFVESNLSQFSPQMMVYHDGKWKFAY